MSPLFSYALQGLALSVLVVVLAWIAMRLSRKELPGMFNVDPGKEWHVSDATRNAALLASDREKL